LLCPFVVAAAEPSQLQLQGIDAYIEKSSASL
jgi:hypothetical protein